MRWSQLALTSRLLAEILLKEPMAFLLCLWCALLLGILYAFFGVRRPAPGWLIADVSTNTANSGLPDHLRSQGLQQGRSRSVLRRHGHWDRHRYGPQHDLLQPAVPASSKEARTQAAARAASHQGNVGRRHWTHLALRFRVDIATICALGSRGLFVASFRHRIHSCIHSKLYIQGRRISPLRRQRYGR